MALNLFPTVALDQAVRAAAGTAIVGVSVGNRADKGTWRIDFVDGTTDVQKAAGQAALQAFDPDHEATQ